MKIVRFAAFGCTKYGVMENGRVSGLAVSPFDAGWDKAHPVFDGTVYGADEIKLLVPCTPTKYMGVGLNFSSAAAVQNRECPDYPITFIKPTGAVIGTGDHIVLPRAGECFFYEGEMAAVIGKECSKVRAEDAYDYVLGYTCSNDVTDTGFFGKDDLKLKGADTFGPVGPCIETDIDPDNCDIKSYLNGELRQHGNTSEMKFSVAYIVEFLSSYMTLYPGDVISMGTPAGFSKLTPGDEVCVELEGIGRLVNPVK